MNVSVTPELEKFVQDLVATGRYHSASEVFREGLRLLERAEHERLLDKWLLHGLAPEEEALLPPEMLNKARADIRAKIQEGLDALNRGDYVDGEEFMAKWKARLDAAAAIEREQTTVQREA